MEATGYLRLSAARLLRGRGRHVRPGGRVEVEGDVGERVRKPRKRMHGEEVKRELSRLWEDAGLSVGPEDGGREEDARRVVSVMKTRIAQGENLSRAEVALIHAGLGEADEAFEWFEKSFDYYDPTLWQLQDPAWDPIRDDPRFERIIRRRRGLEP